MAFYTSDGSNVKDYFLTNEDYNSAVEQGLPQTFGYGLAIGRNTIYSTDITIANVNLFPKKKVKKVSAGGNTIGVLYADGTLWMCGNNTHGELGDMSIVSKSSPVQVAPDKTWSDVSVGNSHVMAVKTDGTLWAWGDNSYGALAFGTPNLMYSSPIQTASSSNGWKSVSLGSSVSFMLKTDGTLWWSGYGYYIGGTSTNKSNPTQITGSWKQVECSVMGAVAIKSDNTLWFWGTNGYGELGPSIAVTNTPVQLPGYIVKDVSMGYSCSSFIDMGGNLYTMGLNNFGQLGNSSTTNSSTPILIGSGWKNISMGNLVSGGPQISQQHTIGIKMDGTLWSWGANGYGQTGFWVDNNRSSPVMISSDTNWKSISSNYLINVGIK